MSSINTSPPKDPLLKDIAIFALILLTIVLVTIGVLWVIMEVVDGGLA